MEQIDEESYLSDCEYHRECSDEKDRLTADRRQRVEERREAILAGVCSSAITAITLALFVWLWSFTHHDLKPAFKYDEIYSTSAPHAEGCGTTVAEAKARNCRFDELSDLWLPQKCSRKYEDEYLRSNAGKPFEYWTDTSGRQRVVDRSELAGGATYYSTTRDHLAHCEFNLYRFAASLKTGELVGHVDDFAGHLEHCAKILSKFAYLAPDIDEIDVDTVSTFGFC